MILRVDPVFGGRAQLTWKRVLFQRLSWTNSKFIDGTLDLGTYRFSRRLRLFLSHPILLPCFPISIAPFESFWTQGRSTTRNWFETSVLPRSRTNFWNECASWQWAQAMLWMSLSWWNFNEFQLLTWKRECSKASPCGFPLWKARTRVPYKPLIL